jgi:hypothetical protein
MYNAKVRLCHLLRLYYVPDCFAADSLFKNHSRVSAQMGVIPNAAVVMAKFVCKPAVSASVTMGTCSGVYAVRIWVVPMDRATPGLSASRFWAKCLTSWFLKPH